MAMGIPPSLLKRLQSTSTPPVAQNPPAGKKTAAPSKGGEQSGGIDLVQLSEKALNLGRSVVNGFK